MIKISSDDIEFIEFAYSLVNTARYPSFQKVTDTYNKVFGTYRTYTSCGSCIRQQVLELKEALDSINIEATDKEKEECNVKKE